MIVDELKGDPFGDQKEMLPVDQVIGRQKGPITLPEDTLEEGKKYVFGGEVAKKLEQEIMPAQIPGYQEMRQRILNVGYRFLKPGTNVLDIGTSQGKTLRDLIATCAHYERVDLIDSLTYFGQDEQMDMLNEAESNIKALLNELQKSAESNGHEVVGSEPILIRQDLRKGLPSKIGNNSCSLITSVLVLQFVPQMYRQKIVADIYRSLAPGGAFIFVEKILGRSHVFDDLYTDVYYKDVKARNGMSQKAIEKKRGSLENYLYPFTHEANLELLEQGGFRPRNIDVFWRNLQFEAILAVKSDD